MNHDDDSLPIVRNANPNGKQPGISESEHTRRLLLGGDEVHVLPEDIEREPDGSEGESRDVQAALPAGDRVGLGSTVKIADIEFTIRAQNALAANRISSLAELCAVSAGDVRQWRNCGVKTQREILQALLQRFIRPPWMREVCQKFIYSACMPVHELRPPGFNYVTSGFHPSGFWMLECVIADMERGSINWCLVKQNDGIALWRKGGLEIEEEK